MNDKATFIHVVHASIGTRALTEGSASRQLAISIYSSQAIYNLHLHTAECGPRPAKTRLRVKNSKIGSLAQNSSMGLVDDVQSENIGEKQEYMP